MQYVGRDLLTIEESVLKEDFGIMAFGHRKKMMRALNALKLERAEMVVQNPENPLGDLVTEGGVVEGE